MQNECVYKHKCNISKILIVAVVSFFAVCAIMFFIIFQYQRKLNQTFQNSLKKTTEMISDIKIENQKNKQIVISDELARAVTKASQGEYENFLRDYYETQNNWLNIWLTIMALVLGFLGLIVPLCFLKFYESKKEEFNIVIREVEKKKETMTQDLEEVKKYVEKAKESEKRVEVNRYFISAMREGSKKNYLTALERINKALDLAPKNTNLISTKADILSDLRRFQEAIPLYEQVIKERPSAGIYNNYADALAEIKDFDRAIEMFSKAIFMTAGEDYRLFCNRGTAFMEKGDTEKALADFNKALQLVPINKSPEEILYNLVECHLKRGNFSDALITLKNFLKNSKTPFIYDDDKSVWLNCLKGGSEQKEVTEIVSLINDLKIKNRINDELEKV